MKNFTHETTGYEQFPAYMAFMQFLDSYLVKRDYKNLSVWIDEDFYSIGTGEEEIAVNKEIFLELLLTEIEVISKPIIYKVKQVCGKEIAPNIWNILSELDVVFQNEKDKNVYRIRCTGCFKLFESGFRILSIHMSEPSSVTDTKAFFALKYSNSLIPIDKEKSEQVIFEIVSKSMPGGIICGYAEEGFPIYFVNEQYLSLLGYSSYEEYYADADGKGMTHIHPEDAEMVSKEIMLSYSTEMQYGIEYRIRHKDGHYISVYDIGKKMFTPDNKEVIICVLYDMTENAKLKEILMREANYDNLTGIYNRGGGIRMIEHELKYTDAFTFAFLDIDNLKQLNDNYNHTAGDTALKYFATLLLRCFDKHTILARIGGDEFIAFFRECLDKERIEAVFEEVEKEYSRYIAESYPDSKSSISIGCITSKKKYSFEELCQTADSIMYEIKRNGKNGYKIVDLE